MMAGSSCITSFGIILMSCFVMCRSGTEICPASMVRIGLSGEVGSLRSGRRGTARSTGNEPASATSSGGGAAGGPAGAAGGRERGEGDGALVLRM